LSQKSNIIFLYFKSIVRSKQRTSSKLDINNNMNSYSDSNNSSLNTSVKAKYQTKANGKLELTKEHLGNASLNFSPSSSHSSSSSLSGQSFDSSHLFPNAQPSNQTDFNSQATKGLNCLNDPYNLTSMTTATAGRNSILNSDNDFGQFYANNLSSLGANSIMTTCSLTQSNSNSKRLKLDSNSHSIRMSSSENSNSNNGTSSSAMLGNNGNNSILQFHLSKPIELSTNSNNINLNHLGQNDNTHSSHHMNNLNNHSHFNLSLNHLNNHSHLNHLHANQHLADNVDLHSHHGYNHHHHLHHHYGHSGNQNFHYHNQHQFVNDDETETNRPVINASIAQFQHGHNEDPINQTYLAVAQIHSNNNENFLNDQSVVSTRNVYFISIYIYS
jgi:hypothetical protein